MIGRAKFLSSSDLGHQRLAPWARLIPEELEADCFLSVVDCTLCGVGVVKKSWRFRENQWRLRLPMISTVTGSRDIIKAANSCPMPSCKSRESSRRSSSCS